MEKLFELTFQDQTLNPQVGTFTDTSQTTGTFTLEDGEYYLTNADTKGFYAYSPVAMQSGLVYDSKVIIEFDLKVVTASANTHAIIGTYAGVDGSGIPTGAKITLQYNAGDIELVLGGGATATLIESADVVVNQWYHFRIDCYLAAPLASTYQVKIDGAAVTTVTGATTDYELGIISVLGTDLHACDECGIKNITLVTETNMFVGRTALDQALQDVKGYVDNQVGACVPLAGTNALSGSIVPDTDHAYDFGGTNYRFREGYFDNLWTGGLFGGLESGIDINYQAGAHLILRGKNRPSETGIFWLVADDGSNSTRMMGDPSGTLTWGSKNIAMAEDVVPRSGGAVISGFNISRINNLGEFSIRGGNAESNGGTVKLLGDNHSNVAKQGTVILISQKSGIGHSMTLYPDGTLVWDGQPIQYISDQRLKQQISNIDDKLLDAWQDVNLVQFKYNDAVDTKKDNARLHTGYVVQQIDDACKSHNVDISEYGLYCHEEYPEETEEIEVEQADGTKVKEKKVIREASEHYSLRYTEALIVECAYLRKCIKELRSEIEELKSSK